MDINNVNGKIIVQLNKVLEELKNAKSSSYSTPNCTRMNISRAEGIVETIKILLE